MDNQPCEGIRSETARPTAKIDRVELKVKSKGKVDYFKREKV